MFLSLLGMPAIKEVYLCDLQLVRGNGRNTDSKDSQSETVYTDCVNCR
jgi:hypothetical protein